MVPERVESRAMSETQSQETPTEQRPKRRRRRRRGGREGGRAPRAPRSARQAQRPLESLHIDSSLPADHPLSKTEVAEMKANLRFIRQHRKALRIKVNAAEDLMLNGAREPEDRGLCLHLLSKVDHSAVQKALERNSDPVVRVQILAGAVRATDDAGVLLLYLEALRDAASRNAAAGAFSLGTNRIDWTSLSEARLERLLSLLIGVFTDEHERASALFSLLHTPSFRALLDGHAPTDELRRSLEPLLAVYEVVMEGKENRFGRPALERGASILLTASEDILRGYPEPVRLRLLESAVRQMGSQQDADRAAGVLLQSLPHTGEDFRRLSLARASELLRSHADARAKWHLEQLRKVQPDCREASEMLRSLRAKRLGRVALGWPQDWEKKGGGPEERGTLRRGFWIDHAHRVWLRIGKAGSAGTFEAEAEIHDLLALPGILPVLVRGKAPDGRPWMALPARGRPAEEQLKARPASVAESLAHASLGLGLLISLGQLGYRLPDARLRRFLVDRSGRLLLADLSGIEKLESEPDSKLHRAAGFGLCRDLLRGKGEELPPELERRLFGMRGSLEDLRRGIEMAR